MFDLGFRRRALRAVVGTGAARQHAPLAVPGDYRLAPTNFYHGGEAVFIKLTDLDQNLNPNVAETVITTIKSANGDSETLRLTETGPSTGVFIGYIQSTFGPVVANDCRLSVAVNTGVNATYTDIVDGSDSTIDGALVDPFGLVFDSTNGNPINGATVTLINIATGAPAQVFCDDGVTPYPTSVISGSSFAACGATISHAGWQLSLPAGGAGHVSAADQLRRPISAFPSTVATANIADAVGRAVFDRRRLARRAVHAESRPCAADRRAARSFERQPADREDVHQGGGRRRRVSAVRARDSQQQRARAGAQCAHRRPPAAGLPLPARVGATERRTAGRSDRLRRMGAVSRSVSATSPRVRPSRCATSQKSPRALASGNAENTAQAVPPITSNVARATVLVREDLFRERAILVGRVIVGSCDRALGEDRKGLANVRVGLEDGRYALTDQDGNWHLDDIRPGTHVVQLDLDSLAEGYELLPCADNTRFAGRKYSQFVNVRGGSLWRADFYVKQSRCESDERTGWWRTRRGAGGASTHTGSAAYAARRSYCRTTRSGWRRLSPAVEWLHPQRASIRRFLRSRSRSSTIRRMRSSST